MKIQCSCNLCGNIFTNDINPELHPEMAILFLQCPHCNFFKTEQVQSSPSSNMNFECLRILERIDDKLQQIKQKLT
jgi:hypothetical protein